MPLKLTDTILSSRPANPQLVLNRLSKPSEQDVDYAWTLAATCKIAGVDPVLALAQWLLETANAQSFRWTQDRNPAGIGIVSNTTAQPIKIPNVEAAAALHVQCLYSIVRRKLHPELDLWPAADEWMDRVWLPKVESSAMPDVWTVKDLGLRYTENGAPRATWSWEDGKVPEDTYGNKLVARAKEFYPEARDQDETTTGEEDQPVAYNYDNATWPEFVDIEIPDNRKYAGWIDPVVHIIRGFVLHSAYGYLQGTTDYFRSGVALTDWMVGNALDGKKLDGELRRFNDPHGPRYSHASGPVSNPIEDAAKFLELYGPDKAAINMLTTALERTCDPQGRGDVTEKEHQKRVHLIAKFANDYGKYLYQRTGEHRLTCDTFPLIPKELNRSFLIYHGEVNSGKRATCPDQQVRASLPRIIADVRTLLAQWQRGTDEIPPEVPPEQMPTYAAPKVIPELEVYRDPDTVPAYVQVGNVRLAYVHDRVRATRRTPRYQNASLDAEPIGPEIDRGLEFAVNWLFFDHHGTAWYITPYWTRVLADHTERVRDAA